VLDVYGMALWKRLTMVRLSVKLGMQVERTSADTPLNMMSFSHIQLHIVKPSV
jgi:hypothetical protein